MTASLSTILESDIKQKFVRQFLLRDFGAYSVTAPLNFKNC
jgi:hypothetical protein